MGTSPEHFSCLSESIERVPSGLSRLGRSQPHSSIFVLCLSESVELAVYGTMPLSECAGTLRARSLARVFFRAARLGSVRSCLVCEQASRVSVMCSYLYIERLGRPQTK